MYCLKVRGPSVVLQQARAAYSTLNLARTVYGKLFKWAHAATGATKISIAATAASISFMQPSHFMILILDDI